MSSTIALHRTAMARSRLSRPVALAIDDGVLAPSHKVFDYGCGRGDDVRHLRDAGFGADGWDPVHRKLSAPRPADVVNLGYVLNVVADPEERARTLERAWALTRHVLIVSARLNWESRELAGRPFGDGIITRTGTFQKFYDQLELGTWIEEVVGEHSVAAAPGIYYVFRHTADAQEFLVSRVRSYRPRIRIDPHALFDRHKDALAPLLDFMDHHARAPRRDDLRSDEINAVEDAVGSVARGVRLIHQVTPADHWLSATMHRRQDLLVYIALSRFGRRPRLSQLSPTLIRDIKCLFGSYQSACDDADRLLYAAGDKDALYVAAHASPVGKLTPTALYVHRDALPLLPPLLRVYRGCSDVLVGTVASANMLKLSVTEAQVSYLAYPRFDRDAHPTLAASLTVNLDRLSVKMRSYSDSENPPLLHRKEEFLGADDPRYRRFSELTKAEVRAGLYERPERIGTLQGWQAILREASVEVRGHRLVRHHGRGTDDPSTS